MRPKVATFIGKIMDKISSKEWTKKRVNVKNIENRETVSVRATYTESKKISIRISIGLVICDLLALKKGDRVEVFSHKRDKNILLIRKSQDSIDDYKLSHSSFSHYLTLDFICSFSNEYKISQAIKVDFDFNQNNLILNISKLIWEK